jgi:hypothetical protein
MAADDPTPSNDLEGESRFEFVGDVLLGTKLAIVGYRTGLSFLRLATVASPFSSSPSAGAHHEYYEQHQA